ncbi:MAG TPA: ATP-binding protein, partial [Gemmatimonadales bacterium]|nr:ATP-binding protein [Gemmatimonadales bacterium]
TAYALRQREATLGPAARRETEAYAHALTVALEFGFRDEAFEGVQEVINEVSRQSTVYGIQVYDDSGRVRFISEVLRTPSPAPSEILRQVLGMGESVTVERLIESNHVLSVVRPIRDRSGRIRGAMEVAQPLSLLETEKANTQRRFVLNTITLVVALTLVTLSLVGRFVGRPIERFAGAVRALGQGDLSHRAHEDPGGGELAELAREFNRMADHLEGARANLVREAQERIALERQVRESARLAAVGSVSAGLAHQIGAPLNVILGRAEMLLKRDRGDPDAVRNLRIIVDQTGRISATVRSLLDFARHRTPRIQLTDLAMVLRRVMEETEAEALRNGVKVEGTGLDPVWVRGDQDLLHQVFANLVANGIQAAAEREEGKREVVIRVSGGQTRVPAAPEGPAHSAGLEARHWARVDVQDSGRGISPEVLPHMFEPFVTTKPKGTGLGLAIARSLVESHGGSLEGQNVDDAGALFRVTLPAASNLEAADA